MSTTVRVSVDVKKKLDELKKRLGLKRYSDVIEMLVNSYESPKTALETLYYWIEDAREDVKKLAQLLETLVKIFSEKERPV
jgi:predicted CopG family antitoxin